jgi:rhodanese-related sulfurtransferase
MPVTRITIDEAKQRLDRGEPLVFIDCRNPEAWSKSSVQLPGAIRVPPGEARDHLDEIDANRAIVTYCTCPNEGSSSEVAEELHRHGFKNPHPLFGGFDAWEAAQFPLEPKRPAKSSAEDEREDARHVWG